jgi:plasmid stabilization system protein ParE
MACKIEIQDSAHKDIEEILAYLSSVNPTAADLFYANLKRCVANLGEGLVGYTLSRFPELAGAGYHALPFDDYIILYFQEDDTRTIAHVFHQRQDYASLV